jgi:lipopolysaccharide export LptBFGC system permease protein LptF
VNEQVQAGLILVVIAMVILAVSDGTRHERAGQIAAAIFAAPLLLWLWKTVLLG